MAYNWHISSLVTSCFLHMRKHRQSRSTVTAQLISAYVLATPLLPQPKISSFLLYSVAVQLGLPRTWLESLKTRFMVIRLIWELHPDVICFEFAKKGADQLYMQIWAADQCLWFCCKDSNTPLLPKSELEASSHILPVCVRPCQEPSFLTTWLKFFNGHSIKHHHTAFASWSWTLD